jgi:SAM-dependent methyltransferase
MNIKYNLRKINFLLCQFGIDLIKLINSLRGLSNFFYDWFKFKKNYKGLLKFSPCLHDRYEEAGIAKSEYFWQDLLVARWIHNAAPSKHVDIGSRIDGFVAHIASFREIEVFDIRPITTNIPGIKFTKMNLMDFNSLTEFYKEEGYCDSISCLHAIEHFGLGRYGDPINPNGYQIGLENMAKLLRPGGFFYLSTPIGKQRVEFNANWVFDPRTILSIAKENRLELKKLTIFSHTDGVYELDVNDKNLSKLSQQDYSLGIFTFIKSITKEK